MADCVFCDIVHGHAVADVVLEDDLVLAIMDIDPVTEGHLLVIPREHAVGLGEVPPATAARMMTVAQRLAVALRASTLRCEGVNLFLADGEAAFQEVFHCHLHVFPRHAGDGFTIDARWGDSTGEQRRRAAEAVRSVLPG